jgi:hypothetical protein
MNKMINTQKGSILVWILVIIVTLVIVGSLYFYSNKMNLKTYSGHGISFEYNPIWNVSESYDSYSKNIVISLRASSTPCTLMISSSQRTKAYGDTNVVPLKDFMKGAYAEFDKMHPVVSMNNVSGFGESGNYVFPYLTDKALFVAYNGPESGTQEEQDTWSKKCPEYADNLVKTLKVDTQ